MSNQFDFRQLVELCRSTHEQMQRHAARSVHTALVVRNWLFGWHIVEFEQHGADRATYGDRVIEKLSNALKEALGRGFSVRNLEMYRRFYQTYLTIPQTVSADSPERLQNEAPLSVSIPQTLSAFFGDMQLQQISDQIGEAFRLSWSHYVVLMTIDNTDERRFYEIEALENSWSIRELERQIASSLRAKASREMMSLMKAWDASGTGNRTHGTTIMC